MRNGLFKLLLFTTLCSCKSSVTDNAITWTNDIKGKIIKDSNVGADSTYFDPSFNRAIFLKQDKKLKEIWFWPKTNDTAVIILYGADQDFQLVRELCPVNERSFEGVRFKESLIGFVEFKYCSGQIKESGFNFKDRPVGKWTKYDLTGKVLETQEHGDVEKLEMLRNIQYYR